MLIAIKRVRDVHLEPQGSKKTSETSEFWKLTSDSCQNKQKPEIE